MKIDIFVAQVDVRVRIICRRLAFAEYIRLHDDFVMDAVLAAATDLLVGQALVKRHRDHTREQFSENRGR